MCVGGTCGSGDMSSGGALAVAAGGLQELGKWEDAEFKKLCNDQLDCYSEASVAPPEQTGIGCRSEWVVASTSESPSNPESPRVT
eukprot:gene11690-34415_t